MAVFCQGQSKAIIKAVLILSHANTAVDGAIEALAREIPEQMMATLLDEASMAYIPQSLYAAGLAGKRIVYFGDFKQLAPIAMAEGHLDDKQQFTVFKVRKGRPSFSIRLPPAFQHYAEGAPFDWLPLTIVDKKIIHYGFPFCVDEQVKSVLLIRFEGEATGRFLASQLGFVDDAGSLLGDDASIGFRNFVEKSIRCSQCKRPMTVKRNRRIGKYLIGCSGYPSCSQKIRKWRAILEAYLPQYAVICQRCGG